jgi:hypothetical protein
MGVPTYDKITDTAVCLAPGISASTMIIGTACIIALMITVFKLAASVPCEKNHHRQVGQ